MSKRNPPVDQQKKPDRRFPDSDTTDRDEVRYERMPKEKPKKDKKEKPKKDKKSAEKVKKENIVVTDKKSSLDRVETQELLPGRRESLSLAQLSKDEELFFEKVEEGNVREVDKFLKEHRNLNVNCINFCGVSALHVAVENKDIATVKLLLDVPGLHIKDCAQHAVATGDVDFATAVLDIIKNINSELEKEGCKDSTDYSPDITPLMLAAQNGDFKMVRLLIERGHVISKPHAPDCLCPSCKTFLRDSGSSMSQIRLNAYKAVANPTYICQVTDDPILYCFEIDREMETCSDMDKEFKVEYEQLGTEVRDFTVQLLSQCRDTAETEMLLQLPWGFDEGGPKIKFPRVQLALDYKQREFVAHSLVQQVLTAHWLGEFRSWPRLSLASKMLHCFLRFLMLPFLSLALVVMPWYRPLKKYHSPLNRFLLHLVSYLLFLLMVFLLNLLDTGKFHKGPPQTGVEGIVIIYVFGHIWATIRQLWVEGRKRFFRALWNWYDLIMELVFVMTFIIWIASYAEVLEDRQHKRKVLERKFWRGDDSALVHEALFSVGIVLAFGKLAYFCQQSSRLGPFQVSMSRMVLQIAYFLAFCLLVITTFSIALTRMYAYYDGMKRTDKDGNVRTQLSTFSTFGNSFRTLFWGMFGMSPAESADVVIENLSKDDPTQLNTHGVTEGTGTALFAFYEIIMIIALVNTLIAILSNTFQRVVDNADVEFKFARAKLWNRFFDDSTLLPPPFNLCPTANFFTRCTTYFRALAKNVPKGKAKFSLGRCCYVEYEEEKHVDAKAYQELMINLVQRYFRSKEQEDDE